MRLKSLQKLVVLAPILALTFASCSRGIEDLREPRVIVLGIDGGTWTVIEPMMEAGELPNLKKLYDRGLHGVLGSRRPIISPVVWTTIFTGFGWEKHGLKSWKNSRSVNRRVRAIWEILSSRDLNTVVFNVPGTWPPDPVHGVMLSGFPFGGTTAFGGNTGEIYTREHLVGENHPHGHPRVTKAYQDNISTILASIDKLGVGEWSPWLDGGLKAEPDFLGKLRAFRLAQDKYYLSPLYRVDDGVVVSFPETLRAEISEKIGEPYIPEGPGWSKWNEPDMLEALYPHLEQIFRIQSKAALEYAATDWSLFLYVMTLVDRVSHPYWAYAHPDDFPKLNHDRVARYGSRVADSYRRTDEELGRILAEVSGDPYVMVVSDHGFHSLRNQEKPLGEHDLDGIYLISGPGITHNEGHRTHIEDITPTLLYLLDMPIGRDMEGKPFDDVLMMIGREPQYVVSWETTERESTEQPVDRETWESLRGLGYVDGEPPRAEEPRDDKVNAPHQSEPPTPRPEDDPSRVAHEKKEP